MSMVLREYGVQFLDSGVPEQLHCPFHYPDTNKSARFYPDNDSIFCFVCDRTWNVFDFIQEKEELSVVETIRFIKAHYEVEEQAPDYLSAFFAMRKTAAEGPEEMAQVVETLFVKQAESLTSGNIYSILTVYNECLAAKDDLVQSGNFTHENLTRWYEASRAKLRTEIDNG